MNDREAYIALNMMERVGPVGVRAMAESLGSVAAIFTADRERLQRAPGIGRETAAAVLAQRDGLDWCGECERTAALGARIVAFADGEYPRELARIHDPPLALYVRGTLQARDRRAIAVVGTRRPTQYGRAVAEKLAYGLAKAGFTVVSGLAEGIDTAAHRGALKAGGRTLAVIGSALDCLYPASNAGLADEVAAAGAVLSEFRLGRQPDKTTFPMRNRVVSGLSMGTLVVEAGPGSGALITAREAAEQGRTLFAVPGRIDNRGAVGPHRLIRDGARLVESVEDVLEEFDGLFARGGDGRNAADEAPVAARGGAHLGDEEQRIVAALRDGPVSVDALIRATGLPAARVGALLIGLEMKRQVRMMPGRMVERAGA